MFSQVVLAASRDEGTVTTWDLDNGSVQTTYKQNACCRNGLRTVGRDYFVASQMGRGVLHFWTWHKEQVHLRCFTKEPLLCVAATPCGSFILGGSGKGSIFCWDATSGLLLREWVAHYKAVTCLAFSSDGHVLLSGGDDAAVNSWLLSDVLSTENYGMVAAVLQPFCSWSEHTLPVTSICCGTGGINSVAVSAALDRSCKVYSLHLRTVLLSVALPVSLHAVALDPGQFAFFAGGSDGRVFEVPLADPLRAHPGGPEFATIEPHADAVTSVSVAPDGCHLVSGSEDGTVAVIEIRSRQIVRRLSAQGKGPVASVLAIERPAWMPAGTRNVDGGKAARSKGPSRPQPLAPLQKYATESASERWLGPTVLLTGSAELRLDADGTAMMPTPPMVSTGGGDSARDPTGALQMCDSGDEVQRLRRQLAETTEALEHMKQVHSSLHKYCVQEILGSDQ
mmetsp:Transcript_42549/g.100994  ORF Transcript_42549/g.100994 Transcript_42549/m.100994 type:complete len:452 (+) Transcript_42549:115-1470(+)